jgi:phosphoribosyl-ATP pyrophosphohydrolase
MSEHPIDRLFATIASRKGGDAEKSYTAQLLAKGVAQCARKFGEESVETVIAAMAGDKKQLAAESADVVYHLLVLWAAAGITPGDVYADLEARQARSGLEEKKARAK